jgi:hypothetical protein
MVKPGNDAEKNRRRSPLPSLRAKRSNPARAKRAKQKALKLPQAQRLFARLPARGWIASLRSQ